MRCLVLVLSPLQPPRSTHMVLAPVGPGPHFGKVHDASAVNGHLGTRDR